MESLGVVTPSAARDLLGMLVRGSVLRVREAAAGPGPGAGRSALAACFGRAGAVALPERGRCYFLVPGALG